MSWFDQRPDDAMMGSFEAVVPEHIATIEAAQFREAMSQLGAAVHVVTTAGPAGTAGFTATAVSSVSDQPRRCSFASTGAVRSRYPAGQSRAVRQHAAGRNRPNG